MFVIVSVGVALPSVMVEPGAVVGHRMRIILVAGGRDREGAAGLFGTEVRRARTDGPSALVVGNDAVQGHRHHLALADLQAVAEEDISV